MPTVAAGAGSMRVPLTFELASWCTLENYGKLWGTRVQRIALADFIARQLKKALLDQWSPCPDCPSNSAGNSATIFSRAIVSLLPPCGPYVLEQDFVRVTTTSEEEGGGGVLIVSLPSPHRHDADPPAPVAAGATDCVVGLIRTALGALDWRAAQSHVASVEDQQSLRAQVAARGAVGFIGNGCVLARSSRGDPRPLEGSLPFESPASMAVELKVPNAGSVVGMLVPGGVTVICGGGFQGKSTLLRALAMGPYDKIPGDGREFAVSIDSAAVIRAEDGRPVRGVDASAFVTFGSSSPSCDFVTGEASGSTSQAANLMEALEAGARVLLMDEDVCANNFMDKDSRMRALVPDDPITPFIYRVNSLWLELGVSTIVVVGSSGSWFDVHDTVVLMRDYQATDATERATGVSRRFCRQRIQYAGRGLVHRLPWPAQTRLRRKFDPCALAALSNSHVVPKDGACSPLFARGAVDLSRCEQLLPSQSHACSLAAAWIIQAATKCPEDTLSTLLDRMDATLDAEEGLGALRGICCSCCRASEAGDDGWLGLGRPRRLEVAALLSRSTRVRFQTLPADGQP
jgi:hypothetical protein